MPSGVESPREKVVEELGKVRLPIRRLEGMIALFNDDVAQRTPRLLSDRFEREQVGRERRVVPAPLRHKQRHRAVTHIVNRRTLQLKRFPTPHR